MSDAFLHRSEAPLHEETWRRIDEAVRDAAIAELSVRRLLKTTGPFGPGLKALSLRDRPAGTETDDGAKTTIASTIPIPQISCSFTLTARDIDAAQRYGFPLDATPAAAAAAACARKEEQLLYHGEPALGIPGLLSGEGRKEIGLTKWENVGEAADDIIRIIDTMDASGYHGPYALALAPSRYNALFRRYPQGAMIEMQHIRELVTAGIVKAPALRSGGVLLASGDRIATIVLSQDLLTAFEGPEGRAYRFIVSESVALRLSSPDAVCRLV